MEKKQCLNLIKMEKDLLFDGLDSKAILKYHLINHHLVQIARYMKLLRLEEYYRSQNGMLNQIKELWYGHAKNTLGNRLGFYIDPGIFAEGLIIYHHGSIIVNGFARIGKNCKLHGNNCIGNNGKSKGAPEIGDNVEIGFGATVIGDVKIANNIKIGAGAVVISSFTEEGITIGGVPAKKISK